jgi:endo-1,4-beta-D-glucanase Y
MRLQWIRRVIGGVLALWVVGGAAAPVGAAPQWPAWEFFAQRFIQADGRVIDIGDNAKSTSEGQSYALFFALVANQPERFETLLRWTSDNLADGQLGVRLPAWHWGKRDDGSWGVKDANAASDADLWIAYALLEAGRLWRLPHHEQRGRRLLAEVARQEVAQAGRAGTVLLSGPVGFALGNGRWRINPSYVPGFMFRYLAATDPAGPWLAILDGQARLAPQLFSAGIAPDNVVVDADGRVLPDTEAEPSASYDGIRVYLWAGMSGVDGQALVARLAPYAALTRRLGRPPEKVDPVSGVPKRSDYSPIGYSGALLPFLSALGDAPELARQRERVRAAAGQGGPTLYYDQVLILFGQGWIDGQYRFDAQGRLQPRWAR